MSGQAPQFPPQPHHFVDWKEYARQLTMYLQQQAAGFEVTQPSVLQLAHVSTNPAAGNKQARTGADGTLVYDPLRQRAMLSRNGVWEDIALQWELFGIGRPSGNLIADFHHGTSEDRRQGIYQWEGAGTLNSPTPDGGGAAFLWQRQPGVGIWWAVRIGGSQGNNAMPGSLYMKRTSGTPGDWGPWAQVAFV